MIRFFFPFAFEIKHRFENLFLRSLWKVLVLCDFLNLDCLRIIARSRQPRFIAMFICFDWSVYVGGGS